MASRLTHDQHGRLIAIQTTHEVGTPAGTVFVLLGNALEAGGLGCGWLGQDGGRPPTLEEQRGVRNPYVAGADARRRAAERARARVDDEDDEISDERALALCRLEQERNPPDLIGSTELAVARAPTPRPNVSERARGGERRRPPWETRTACT